MKVSLVSVRAKYRQRLSRQHVQTRQRADGGDEDDGGGEPGESRCPPSPLEQLLERLDTQAGVAGDAAHRKGVDRIMTRDSEDADAVRHHDVLTLADDAKSCFLQCPHRIKMIDAGYLRHD